MATLVSLTTVSNNPIDNTKASFGHNITITVQLSTTVPAVNISAIVNGIISGSFAQVGTTPVYKSTFIVPETGDQGTIDLSVIISGVGTFTNVTSGSLVSISSTSKPVFNALTLTSSGEFDDPVAGDIFTLTIQTSKIIVTPKVDYGIYHVHSNLATAKTSTQSWAKNFVFTSSNGVDWTGTLKLTGDETLPLDFTVYICDTYGNFNYKNVGTGLSYPDNITKQGNVFNGVNQLVMLNEDGLLPGLDGSLLYNLTATVNSVFGRVGDVVAEQDDYTFAQLAAKPTTLTGYGITDAINIDQKGANNGVATLDAGGKVPLAQLPSSILIYKGTWVPATNSPTLIDGTGTTGWTYRISTSGTRDLGSGSIDFNAGDYVIYNGTTWEKVDGSDAVTSVNGMQGVVVLTTTNIAEGTNLYHTTTRVRAAVSAAGSIAYNQSTGVFSYTAPTLLSQFTNDVGYITSSTPAPTPTLQQVTTAGNTTTTSIALVDGYAHQSVRLKMEDNKGVVELVSGSDSTPRYLNLSATTLTANRFQNFPNADGTLVVDNTTIVGLNMAGLTINDTAAGFITYSQPGFTGKIGFLTLTGNRTVRFPDASGTVALTEDTSLQVLSDATVVTWNLALGKNAQVTLGGNRTLAITNPVECCYGTLKVIQDGTGSRILTLPANSKVINDGQGSITLTTTPAAEDMLCFFYDGTTFYWTFGKNYTGFPIT